MKTPYGGAIRLRQREMDDLRLAIGASDQKLAEVDAQEEALRTQARQERAYALQDFHFSHDAYAARIRLAHIALEAERQKAEAERALLADQIVETYGSLRAIEKADEQYRARAEWRRNNAEQAEIDDLSAASLFNTRNGRRGETDLPPTLESDSRYAGR